MPTRASAAVGCDPDNIPEPTTTITTPSSGSVLNVAPQNIGISVSIGASGATQRVDYYANGAAIGAALSSPWSITWANVAAGTYSLQAKTTSTAVGCIGTGPLSNPVSVKVNSPPSISISAVSPGTIVTAPAAFTLTANASDSDGYLQYVQWYANGALISGPITAAPYTFTWTNVPAGTYSITASGPDNDGAWGGTSAVTVISNDRPTASLTASNPNEIAPGSITLQATASDVLGGVKSVQYFANGSAIGRASSLP